MKEVPLTPLTFYANQLSEEIDKFEIGGKHDLLTAMAKTILAIARKLDNAQM